MTPNLTSPHLRGPGPVTQGNRAGKHSASINERNRGPDVCVCACVYVYVCAPLCVSVRVLFSLSVKLVSVCSC